MFRFWILHQLKIYLITVSALRVLGFIIVLGFGVLLLVSKKKNHIHYKFFSDLSGRK